MGEEAKITDYSRDSERVTEWEIGLPTDGDITPLSQPLIPPELASAFSISPETYRTLLEVNRASNDTISAIRGGSGGSQAFSTVVEPDEEEEEEADRENGSGTESRKLRRLDSAEDADSVMLNNDDSSARALKRPRLVWTPQLHKRFVDVVAHLGIQNAVPKTIMQLMNVEGLTRENVASHLQKYRLYLKRMQGFSDNVPSSTDQLFASTPVLQSLQDSSAGGCGGGSAGRSSHAQIPMPYPQPPPPHMMAMFGMPHHGFNNGGFQQRDWSSGFTYPQAHTHGLTPSGDK
ncbi:hypothetical protein TanjilG_29750 [Lupinus angustifolius]|uniref:HTH myb-type domain-containing protein n=1 Tax=Lupinus angustifolius TaxID=3871 RepID=A0A1J7HTB1_LUPAN|nr:PREDICTED: transcription factor LUX-like [Lupinus angustifolius]XP_019458895.1 PREDICTED: transcription factor LUX-like [Lupinus angustifolius]OIW03715.1 hypothetical protein TanjilG_29750 [Lupinus angustifolius]